VLGTVALNEGFVAASGDYERFLMHQGRRLHHVLDPHTGYPTQGPHGVALVSEQLEAVNGLGTAIMVAGAKAGRARVAQTPGLDALIVDADNSLWLSPGMARRLGRGA
jgi:thiamine biosynthesis lipoprotein